MKAQIPAEGVMKRGDYGDMKFYEIACNCGQPDHAHSMQVEADDMGVTVNIWTKQSTVYWTGPIKYNYTGDNRFLYMVIGVFKDFINGLLRSLSLTWSIWIKGYVEYEVTTVLSEQEALNYAEALKSAIADVKQFREKEKNK